MARNTYPGRKLKIRKAKKRNKPPKRESGITVANLVRRIQVFADSSAPSWLSTLLKYSHVAMSIIGYVIGSEDKRQPTESVVVPLGGICAIDFGIDEMLAESPYVNGFPSAQVTEWNLTGVDYCMYSSGRILEVIFRAIPHALLGERGGTLIMAIEPLSREATEFEGAGTAKAGERVDSIGTLLAMPNATSHLFDRAVTRRYRPDQKWTAIGVPGTAVEGAKSDKEKVKWAFPLNKYASADSVCGGRPFFRLWIAYEEMSSISAQKSEAMNLSHMSIDLEIKARVELRAPTGQPTIETVDSVVVMNVSTGSIVRRKPITVESGRLLRLNTNRRFEVVKNGRVATTQDLKALSIGDEFERLDVDGT